MIDLEHRCDALLAYLAGALSLEEPRLRAAQALPGGASRETWLVAVEHGPRGAEPEVIELVFRVDAASSLLDSTRVEEYRVCRALYETAVVPVAQPLMLENDPALLGQPFLVFAKVEGRSDPPGVLGRGPRYARLVGEHLISHLASLAADVAPVWIEDVFGPTPAAGHALCQLDLWEARLDAEQHRFRPGVLAARRWLRATAPPTRETVLVHGDYRIGNVLCAEQGITAVIDWELAHPGDPHEDLAWLLLPNWRSRAAPDLACGLLEPAEVLASWAAARGGDVDLDTLRWWTVLCHLKAIAIWSHGVHAYAEGRSRYLGHGALERVLIDDQERWMLEAMATA